MMIDSPHSDSPDDRLPTWSIRAVTLHTGVGEHTLRAWERRFGFPVPVRLPSGHRRYTAEQVRKIVRIRRALELGHRAGEVVSLDDAALEALLVESSTGPAPAPDERAARETSVEEILSTVRRLDAAALRDMLDRGAARSGTRTWIDGTIVPLLERVGREWEAGGLEIQHEHFLSEILEDHLRARRHALESGLLGPTVLLATLPGEQHALGLHLAAITIVESGLRALILGPDTPVSRISAAAAQTNAPVIGISVSGASDASGARDELTTLRQQLDPRIQLWIGGDGAAAAAEGIARTFIVQNLDELRDLATRIPS